MQRKLNILIACEESQAICTEFRSLGHNAYSCDLQECSGGHPEWHFHCDCFEVIRQRGGRLQSGDCVFLIGEWDLIIAHPPCTYLASAQNRLLNIERYGDYARMRRAEREEAAQFFMRFVNLDVPHLAIENPVGYMSTAYRKPDQIIHPYNFGDPVSKATCLWLRGLPTLSLLTPFPPCTLEPFFQRTRFLPTEERRRVRSKTFPGIAHAIAIQWAKYLTQ